jgi:Circularly permutated YpsA SLOG family
VTRLRELTIVSGGQTGADRAALDFAIENGFSHDGWCPRDRRAEDGPLDARYRLRETTSDKYDQRTRWNVRDSDATLVFSIARQLQGGTALTIDLAERSGRPWLHLAREEFASDTGMIQAADKLREFLAQHDVERLNVAGPRASQEPEIAAFVDGVLRIALVP